MSSEEVENEYHRLVRLLIDCYGGLLGFDDKLVAEYYFIGFCRYYVRQTEDRPDQLREYVRTASSQHPVSPSQHPVSPASYPITPSVDVKEHPNPTISQDLFATEELSPPTQLHDTPQHLMQSGQQFSTATPSPISNPGQSQDTPLHLIQYGQQISTATPSPLSNPGPSQDTPQHLIQYGQQLSTATPSPITSDSTP